MCQKYLLYTSPVTKPDKKNTATSKKFDDDIMLKNCEVIVIFPIYGQFGSIMKQDFEGNDFKTCILINSIFYLTKTENRTKKPPT